MRALCGAGIKGGFPMEACLSDNGTEFFDYWKVEGAMKALGVVARTFYARPMRSDDKAEAERNHEIVRYVFPKGKSLDGLTQADLDEAFSNINSYTRLSKGDKTPFELAEARFGRGFCDALNIRKVDKKNLTIKLSSVRRGRRTTHGLSRWHWPNARGRAFGSPKLCPKARIWAMLANPIATKRPKNHENHFVKEIVAFTLSPNRFKRLIAAF